MLVIANLFNDNYHSSTVTILSHLSLPITTNRKIDPKHASKINKRNFPRKLICLFVCVFVSPPTHLFFGQQQQHQYSDSTKVTLRGLTVKSSGIYRCEVSAEAPSFDSVQAEGRMTIVRKFRL